MLELTTDQISSQQLFPISSYELSKFTNWMCLEDSFSQIRSHIYIYIYKYKFEMPSIVKFGKLLQFADDTTLICFGSDCDSVKMQLSHNLTLVSD